MQQETNEKVGIGGYGLLGFLTLLNVMNFVDRQLLSSFANFIVPDLQLSNTEFGILTGFAFIIFYSVMGLFMGALADLVHRPRLIAFGLGLWSLLTAASGMAKGFVSLAIPRTFIGVGESILTPTSMSLLSDRFPHSRLGFASGFYYMGVPIGVGVSLLIVGYLGPAIGWRNCFYALGALGVVLAAVMLFVPESPRQHQITRPDAPKQKPSDMIRSLVFALRSSPALVFTMLGGVCLHFILGAAAFDQLWFVQERGFERAEIALLSGWIAMGAGVLGNIFGGIGGDWWLRRTGAGRPMFLFWVMLILAPFNVMYRLVDEHSVLFWLGLFLGFFQLGAFYGPTFATVQELVPPGIRGSAVAFYLLMLNLVGLGIGITFGGILVDALIARSVSEPYTRMLVIFTAISFLAIPLFYVAGKRYSRDRNALYEILPAEA